jgi:3'-5' exoribonuclease Rv2179c-like domain
MLTHVMLDLKTWGTAPYSTIIMIGACAFDPTLDPAAASVPLHKIITDRFEVAISPSNTGLRVDVDTLMWWMDAERDVARKEWLKMPKVSLREALDGFTDWLRTLGSGEEQDLRIWGTGFDNVLLRQAYETSAREVPWSFRHDRCFRTLRNLLTFEEGHYLGTAHTALADAENQAIRANQIVRRLGIRLT